MQFFVFSPELLHPNVILPFSLSFSIRSVEKARTELIPEIAQLRAKAQEEQKKRENQDSLVRRLQKRVLLLTKVKKKNVK